MGAEIINEKIISKKNIIYIFALVFLLIHFTYVFTIKDDNDNKHKLKYNTKILFNNLPRGFVYLDENNKNGVITLNREKDNGKKRNLYENTKIEDDSLYYNYKEFESLEKELPKQTEYICEFPNDIRPEVQKGYYLSCPKHYKITIDKSFYGRYGNDNTHCTNNEDIDNKDDCGYEPTQAVKELCEGREYCSVVVRDNIYKNKCKDGIPRYLHVDYHCIKNSELEKKKFTIVQFSNRIAENSIEEYSVNEFFQYANMHGYDYELHEVNFVPIRQIYFVKLYSVLEMIMRDLKEKKYGRWIFLVDNDTMIPNPSIKLENFIPDDNKIHFIPAYDYTGDKKYCCGLNGGLLFIQVHEWTVDYLMRSITYPYFHANETIRLREQTTLNNILLNFNEIDHYVVAPHKWYNAYDSEFIVHLMGGDANAKNRRLERILKAMKENPEKFSKTNEQFKKEVSDYYAQPREKQYNLHEQP